VNPRFYFSTFQIGAEKAVKAEVLREHPSLKFAFSRPGFITFKQDDDRKPPLELKHVIFTRLWGEVVGQTKDALSFPALLKQIPKQQIVHLFERDQYVPGDEPDGFNSTARIEKLVKALSPEFKDLKINATPKLGEMVYDLIWVDDFHVFIGCHKHSNRLAPEPGNFPKIHLPEESPARSYLKIEEAIYRFKPLIEKGMNVLEVGCSPGGATMAMINRGLLVTGVDPKFMDEKIYKLPGFKFIQKTARETTLAELKSMNPDWIVMDMNIAPLEALDELYHVITLLRKNFAKTLKLRQGFLTIKLNDWKFAESIPLYLKRLEEMGFRDLHPTQLCSNRQEFFVSASFKA